MAVIVIGLPSVLCMSAVVVANIGFFFPCALLMSQRIARWELVWFIVFLFGRFRRDVDFNALHWNQISHFQMNRLWFGFSTWIGNPQRDFQHPEHEVI